jgi:hypothetical protein
MHAARKYMPPALMLPCIMPGKPVLRQTIKGECMPQ